MINLLRCRFSTGSSSIKSSEDPRAEVSEEVRVGVGPVEFKL